MEGPRWRSLPGLSRRSLPRTFDSLADQQFRWFYISMLGQMAAMNMQMVVRGYLTYVLTGSYAALGLVGLAGALPMLLVSLFGGVVADRLPKRAVIQAGQASSLANAAILAVLLMLGSMRFEWLLLSAAAQGITMALMMPARQSMIPEILGVDRLMNAVALNMAGMNTMRLFAPAAGGFIVSVAGFEWAFMSMVALYVIALLGLARVEWRPASAPGAIGASPRDVALSSLRDVVDGLRYMRHDRFIALVLTFSFVSSIFAMPYLFLLPGYVADIFGGGGTAVGLLISVGAVGSLVGALTLASLPERHRGVLLLAGTLVMGVGLIAFAQTGSYWVAGLFMVIIGVGSALQQALTQGLLHAFVDDAYRGRVMSVFMMQFSVMQFGTFLVGVAAELVGIQLAFVGLGLGLIAVVGLTALIGPALRKLD